MSLRERERVRNYYEREGVTKGILGKTKIIFMNSESLIVFLTSCATTLNKKQYGTKVGVLLIYSQLTLINMV